MTEWFSPEAGRWFALFALFALFGAATPLIVKGIYKKLVISIVFASIALGAALIALSFVARAVEQPVHVIRPLMVSGFVLVFVFGTMFVVVRQGYAQAEQRKILARDM